MPRAKLDIETKICDAALHLAAKRGWNILTLEQIAKAAKVPPAQAYKVFSGKNVILPAAVRHIDRQVKSGIGKIDPRAAPHDRLFEVMMARFDMLQKYREGVLAILADCRRDLGLARLIVPAHISSMEQMLSLAHFSPMTPNQPLIVYGLLGVYYKAIWHWQKDLTADMASTMAALDRGLRHAKIIMEFLFRNK